MIRYKLIESDVAVLEDEIKKPVFVNWWWISKILGRRFSMPEKQYYMKHYRKQLSALIWYDLWAKICGFVGLTVPTIGLILNNGAAVVVGGFFLLCYVVCKIILWFKKWYFSKNYWMFYTEGHAIKLSESDILNSVKDLTVNKVKSLANEVAEVIKKMYISIFVKDSEAGESMDHKLKVALFGGLISAAAIIGYILYSHKV